jgi:hypothetical protein
LFVFLYMLKNGGRAPAAFRRQGALPMPQQAHQALQALVEADQDDAD